jgi:hypothetical protein
MNPTNSKNITLPVSVYMNPKLVAINLDIICEYNNNKNDDKRGIHLKKLGTIMEANSLH